MSAYLDNARFFLIAAVVFCGFLIWDAWQTDYAAAPTEVATTERPAATATAPAPVEETDLPAVGALPAGEDSPAPPVATAAAGGDHISVRTDVLALRIDTVGGVLDYAALPGYPVTPSQPDEPVVLLSEAPAEFFIVQSGLLGEGLPDHRQTWQAERPRYVLAEDAETLVVPLTWQQDGRTVTKRFVFTRGSYEVEVQYEIRNAGEAALAPRQYAQLQQRARASGGTFFVRKFRGAAYYDGKYHQLSFEDLGESPVDVGVQGGWASMLQHYFLAAAIPPADSLNRYYSRGLGENRYLIGFVGEAAQIAPGAQGRLSHRLYLGPKAQDHLDEVAPGLSLTVDYGWLTIIARPLFWVLALIHDLIGNWGWSIVILTLLIKLAFYKLSEAQYRSMAKMRRFAPRIQALRERFGDDRQKLNEAMMDLYRKEKFNPLGGCLPLLVQMPVFIALYWVLIASVDLRHAGFMFWIDDLSSPDPLFILPVLFGISMLAQQKLSAQTITDPIQQRVMMFMPIGLTIFFAFFPAGLVLYWLANNLLSIVQQWYIMRKVDAEAPGGQAANA
ncbi:MAG: membrane protein insertase YidC [Pseudomonadota bacterium]|nr:membrane protein insertase YidC [Pseudomonadota bacterium]